MIIPNQRYLKFPLTLPLSPTGERGRGEGVTSVRRKFPDLLRKNLNPMLQKGACMKEEKAMEE